MAARRVATFILVAGMLLFEVSAQQQTTEAPATTTAVPSTSTAPAATTSSPDPTTAAPATTTAAPDMTTMVPTTPAPLPVCSRIQGSAIVPSDLTVVFNRDPSLMASWSTNGFDNFFLNSSVCSYNDSFPLSKMDLHSDTITNYSTSCDVMDAVALESLLDLRSSIDVAVGPSGSPSFCWSNQSVFSNSPSAHSSQMLGGITLTVKAGLKVGNGFDLHGCELDLTYSDIPASTPPSTSSPYKGKKLNIKYVLISRSQSSPNDENGGGGSGKGIDRNILLIAAVVVIVLILVALCGCGIYGYCVKRRRRHAAQLRALGMEDAGQAYHV